MFLILMKSIAMKIFEAQIYIIFFYFFFILILIFNFFFGFLASHLRQLPPSFYIFFTSEQSGKEEKRIIIMLKRRVVVSTDWVVVRESPQFHFSSIYISKASRHIISVSLCFVLLLDQRHQATMHILLSSLYSKGWSIFVPGCFFACVHGKHTELIVSIK